MVNLDVQNGVVQFAPPAVVAGEVASRVLGLTVNEWFYIVAIVCMLISTLTTSIVAVIKSRRKNKDKEDE
ncbi:putative lysis protein [Ralstonia phage phiITL-1]|uniref:Putative lysis protein n=1 Tax=Ralstonia phage phiITL-1 TaxID=1597967 RepID=A0A0U1ZI31_9CAUD|nr:holin [Ralstonia phage phiITL-1]AJT60794.1 putative lysis protein [Ralstonia phage phiITL-1]